MSYQPHYTVRFGKYHLLWFLQSNTYSCVDEIFFKHLKSFFFAKSKVDFCHYLIHSFKLSTEVADWQYQRIQEYLESCNRVIASDNPIPLKESKEIKLKFSKYYLLRNSIVQLGFSDAELMKLIHPSISHLETFEQTTANSKADITLINDFIRFAQDGGPVTHYELNNLHKLQGKVSMYLMNTFHGMKEIDWLGLFHASAVAKNERALLLFGASGSGKSTLTGLLAAHGFELLADDLVPMLAKDQKLYQNPAAVNIKEASYEILEAYWPHSSAYTERIHTKGKGASRYIPMHTHLESKGYACQQLIKVRYQKDSPARLDPMDFKEGLETLIPEAWLHPDASNAQAFMQWLGTVRFFELTYSDFKEALPLLEQLCH
jgi:hypothetical protein